MFNSLEKNNSFNLVWLIQVSNTVSKVKSNLIGDKWNVGRGQKTQNFSYKIQKSWWCNIQHDDHS